MTQGQMTLSQELRRVRAADVARRVRKEDPETSHEAAEKVTKDGSCLYWYRKIYKVLCENKDAPQGHTAKEIAALIDEENWEEAHKHVWRRLKEMEENGWIIRSKHGRESRIGYGKERMCWAVEGKGKEVNNGEEESQEEGN